MSKAFPTDEPFLSGYYAPLHTESDAAHLPITGELPAGLRGTLYRNGPNPQFAPRGRYHWFSGDGMLHAFHLDQGARRTATAGYARPSGRWSMPTARASQAAW
jgi:carotenoid cleavage dioxygenase-like enzyme